MNLGQIRAAVRDQTMTLQEELANATIDNHVQQAFDRTIAMENLWPFYEKRWVLILPAGQFRIDAPADVNWPSVQSMRDDYGRRLSMIDPTEAEDWFGSGLHGGPVNPSVFTVWGGDIELWPHPRYEDDRTFTLRGHRLAANWLTGNEADVPDCDARLHGCFVNFAVALAYAQQEDMVLEDRYMLRWERDMQAARAAIMEPVRDRPMKVGVRPQTRIGPGRLSAATGWRINTP